MANEIRRYLQQRVDDGHRGNNVYQLLRLSDKGVHEATHSILLGPVTDRDVTTPRFRCVSGAEIAFQVSLSSIKGTTTLIAYRFTYVRREDNINVRFDLDSPTRPATSGHPRCHVHLSHQDLRLPYLVLPPETILRILFEVFESGLSRRR